MKWNVVWQVDPDELMSCIERDWFYEIVSLVPINAVQVDHKAKPSLQLVQPRSIICASCPNQTDQFDLIQYLKRVPKPRVLYHMSDEFVDVGHDPYRHCQLVIRNGSANFEMFDDPHFIQIPLGYVTGLQNSSRAYEASTRRMHSFAFLGTVKHERDSEMPDAFQVLRGPHFLRKTESFAAALDHCGAIGLWLDRLSLRSGLAAQPGRRLIS